MTEHKACPFCGSRELRLVGLRVFYAECRACGTRGRKATTREGAWRLWDERAGGVEPTESEPRDG